MSIASALAKIATAETRLAQTTIDYPLWKKRADAGYYPHVKNTKWWQALDALSQAKGDLMALQQQQAAAGLTYLFGDKSRETHG